MKQMKNDRPSSASRTSLVLKLTIAGIASALTLGLLELCAGFLLNAAGPPPAYKDTVAQTLQWLDINLAPLVRDADLIWRNQPLARRTQPINPRPFGRDETWTIEINAEGFRGEERARGLTGDPVLRVLCVGDSVTFGFNVDQPDSYPAQLQALMRSRHPGREIEVINAGVPGWSWLQGLRFLETRGLALDVDVVLMAHGTNDQFMTATTTDAERFQALSRPLRREIEVLRLLLERTQTYRAVERFTMRHAEEEKPSRGCLDQIQGTGHCKRVGLHEIPPAIEQARERVMAAGADFAVLNLDFMQTPAVTAARQAHERLGMPFIDAVDEVLGIRDREDARRGAELGLMPATATGASRGEGAIAADSWSGLLRVQVPQRDRSYSVRGEGVLGANSNFDGPLYDDGTHGDERAGDGVFSARFPFPRSIGTFRFKFFQGDLPEFDSLPPMPSQFGDRAVRPSGDFVTPVFRFGDLAVLAERTHPNARGHSIVAAKAADLIENLPAFAERR